MFSAVPSDMEMFRARIFSEPLVKVMARSADENTALVAAVAAYNSNRALDVAPFEFLSQYPASS